MFTLLLMVIFTGTGCIVLSKDIEDAPVYHQTRLGNLTGVRRNTSNGQVFVFKKIPYAKPPINNLRFRKAVPASQWTSVLNATAYGPSCYHYISNNDRRLIPNEGISEDCLFLNIFIPNDMDRSRKRAVMIWVHGGGFVTGQGMMFDGGELALRGDVIVVTINYRLNVFGFFTTLDSSAPGNFGIWDQRMAIQWVKENIIDYGGDAGLITILGESAGGTSVNLLSLSPKNYGLFQRVIDQSGTIVGPLDNGTNALETSRLISRYVNCLQKTSDDTLACLRTKTPNDLLRAFTKASGVVGSRHFTITYALGPIQDGELLPFDPQYAISNTVNGGNMITFKSVDIMIGTNNAEAGLLKFKLGPCKNKSSFNVSIGIPHQVLCQCMAPAISREFYDQKCQDITTAICKMYSSKDNSLQSQTSEAVNLYNDVAYFNPTLKVLNSHATLSNGTTYHYLFSHKPNWGLIQDRATWLNGANHADELVFVFGLKAWYPETVKITAEETLLSHRMMEYWTNFAKYGNPNRNGLPNWTSYNTDKNSYIDLNLHIETRHSFFKDRMNFWLKDIPELQSRCENVSGVDSYKYSFDTLLALIINLLFVLIIQ